MINKVIWLKTKEAQKMAVLKITKSNFENEVLR